MQDDVINVARNMTVGGKLKPKYDQDKKKIRENQNMGLVLFRGSRNPNRKKLWICPIS